MNLIASNSCEMSLVTYKFSNAELRNMAEGIKVAINVEVCEPYRKMYAARLNTINQTLADRVKGNKNESEYQGVECWC